jgi:UDP-N-acetylglucosamine 2-epimerase (non-hydrolysing)
MKQRKIIIIIGTRPEAIKLAPVILALRKNYNLVVCNTEQQKELAGQALTFFGIKADVRLDAMRSNQTLVGVQSRILEAFSGIYQTHGFDATIVQGDTMSAFCGALAGFYNHVPVFHVEAGLRSYNLREPFPEEAMRQMISRITSLHFAPTELSVKALLSEGVPGKKVFLTGNTGIDALSCLDNEELARSKKRLAECGVRLDNKVVLLTAHRRENHGERLDGILSAVAELTEKYSDHQFILPVHPNPNVHDKVYALLGKIQNIILTMPLAYPELVCIMRNAKLILTDSGGIQEEAPTFGVPVLVMRYETERTEGVSAGFAKLVGADRQKIIAEASTVLSKDKSLTRLDGSRNPYGDGHASRKIVQAIGEFWK